MNFQKHVGKYKVHNKAKYVADLQEVVYRSSWELKYMKYLDRHPAVLEWGSENVIIPYYNQIEKKTRRYFQEGLPSVYSSVSPHNKEWFETRIQNNGGGIFCIP